MSRTFVLAESAARDLDEIIEYVLANSGPRRALHVNNHLEEAFTKLCEQPGIGHVRDDLGNKSLRAWRVFSFLVIYRPKTSPLEIVRVVHGARDLQTLFGEAES